METMEENNATPWLKGLMTLGPMSILFLVLGNEEIGGLLCCGAIFTGLIGGVMAADAKQKAIREGSEFFNSTGYQLQENPDGTWEYVTPETIQQETIEDSPQEITTQSETVEIVEESKDSLIDKKSIAAAAVGTIAGAGAIAAVKQKATEHIEFPDQLIERIKQSGIQPDDLLKFADFNKDGLIDVAELTGAITAALGVAIPYTVVKGLIDKVDSDGDSALNRAELDLLWQELGIPLTNAELEVDEEPETEEIVEEAVEEIVQEEEVEIEEVVVEEEPEIEEVVEFFEDELTEGIDTPLEQALILLEEARLSSERKEIIESHGRDHKVTIHISRVEKTILGSPEYRGGITFRGELDGGPYEALLEMPVALSEALSEYDKGDTIVAIAHLSDWKSGLKRAVLEGVELVGP